jgi:uncharacterized protein (TIGR02246 family)
MNENERAVAAVLGNYQDALNASNTDVVMKLYAPDGVFMPQNSPSSVGADEVRKAYKDVFQRIKLSVKFSIAEVAQVAPDWICARSNSAGTGTVSATGAKSAEANQELFIFKKSADGKWKIARYCFPPLTRHARKNTAGRSPMKPVSVAGVTMPTPVAERV